MSVGRHAGGGIRERLPSGGSSRTTGSPPPPWPSFGRLRSSYGYGVALQKSVGRGRETGNMADNTHTLYICSDPVVKRFSRSSRVAGLLDQVTLHYTQVLDNLYPEAVSSLFRLFVPTLRSCSIGLNRARQSFVNITFVVAARRLGAIPLCNPH